MNIKTILTNYWESIKSYLVTNYQPKGSYSDSGHNHDNRYYTETEIDTKLSGKSDTDHLHDNRYYTETEIDTKLSGKSDTSHNHNSAYLGINATATKATNNANGKELVDSIVKNISINGRTITVTKLDGTTYTLTTQDNNTTYSKLSEFTNDPGFITSSGSCNYATSAGSANSVAWANVSGKPTSYTPSSHTHDDRYYTESEVNSLLGGKSNTDHTHSQYLTGITKSMVTSALGYTPPTQDTNTTYSAGSNITLTGTTFSLTKANVTSALGYTPLSSHQDISGKANTSGTYPNLNVGYADIAGNGVDSSGGTWIRFNSGIQMLIMTHVISNQWNNFSMPFINVGTMSMVVSPVDSTTNSLSAKVDEYTSTRYFVRVYNNDDNNAQYSTSCTIFAMGYWK